MNARLSLRQDLWQTGGPADGAPPGDFGFAGIPAAVGQTSPHCLQFLACCRQVGDGSAPTVEPPAQRHIDFTPAEE